MERALKYLKRTKEDGACLIWTGALNSDGYPRANIQGDSNVKVHRYIFEAFSGFSPDNVRHTCDTPSCINPDHLINGTILDNIKDRGDRGRTSGYVTDQERENVALQRNLGLSYKDISTNLNIKLKRVGYILSLLKHKE